MKFTQFEPKYNHRYLVKFPIEFNFPEIENILHCKFIRVQDSKINSYEDFKIQVIKNII